ncbi:GNAT family N-acetyltransferase [Nostoc sp. 3335mG]|nr:GNAT family N-acetyltransferase [Nostoc sp. 3335mG]
MIFSMLCPAFPSTARTIDHLPDAIDAVAASAVSTHRFLRRQWYAAATETYGGTARTLLVERGGRDMLALPLVPLGPALLRMGQVPGSYWPFRSGPVAQDARSDDFAALLAEAGRQLRGFRLGPVYDGDPMLAGLQAAAAAAGWRVLPRFLADSYLLDIAARQAEGPWPRLSTLRKNRFNEKHLAALGAPEWSFAHGGDWTSGLFDDLASVERASWLTSRTDGRDAKFMDEGHGRFWRSVARDPVLAEMMWVAMLRMDGRPAAFSFDLNVGTHKYAIANSYDLAFRQRSPGRLLYYRNLVRAAADGITQVDWGAGDSGYKRLIGAEQGAAIRDWLFLRLGLPALTGTMFARRWAKSGQIPDGGDVDAG